MNELEKIIREMIAAQGPISVAAYMELALQHPKYGYYRVREPLGRSGDFITAPEVSQMFGEMIGVWCVEAWKALGSPNPFALIELGPGRGTMMRDLLRATAHVSAFRDALKLYLIDSDKVLREKQSANLAEAAPQFLDDIADAPAIPVLVFANEFFDALPVRQFEKTFRGWDERMVTCGPDGLGIILRPLEEIEINWIPTESRNANPGVVIEISPKAQVMMRDAIKQLKARQGAMLVVDYGYVAPSGNATVQAVSKHVYTDFFERPGEVDLTAHVDFTALIQTVREAGAQASKVIGQGEFLRNLGIEIRADALKKRASLPQAAAIDSELRRLIDDDKMGSLFRVMEIRG